MAVLPSAAMRRLLICFLTLILFLAPSAAQNETRTQNEAPQSVSIKGLKEAVTITHDERGIPYIQAKNDEDLYFAQGYATAADRLWQMDLLRRTARGELSEIFGNRTLDEDKRHRTFGFAQVAEAEVLQAKPQARAVLEAYA